MEIIIDNYSEFAKHIEGEKKCIKNAYSFDQIIDKLKSKMEFYKEEVGTICPDIDDYYGQYQVDICPTWDKVWCFRMTDYFSQTDTVHLYYNGTLK